MNNIRCRCFFYFRSLIQVPTRVSCTLCGRYCSKVVSYIQIFIHLCLLIRDIFIGVSCPIQILYLFNNYLISSRDTRLHSWRTIFQAYYSNIRIYDRWRPLLPLQKSSLKSSVLIGKSILFQYIFFIFIFIFQYIFTCTYIYLYVLEGRYYRFCEALGKIHSASLI